MNLLRILSSCLMLASVWGQSSPASIDGVVVNRLTGAPMAEVSVDLVFGSSRLTFSGDTGRSSRATTDADGRFRFSNVVAGEYRLVAVPEGAYLPVEYGQQTPKDHGRPLVLTSGQTIAGIKLEITPTGTISGRVVDRDGEPLVRGAVQALQTVSENGADVLTIVQSVLTNDRGEYRMFWLAPGRYYVSAVARGWGEFSIASPGLFGTHAAAYSPTFIERVLPTGESVEEVAQAIYYPNATEAEAARVIELQPGADISNIDMIAQSTRPRRISGTVVIGDTGQPPPNGQIVEVTPRTQSHSKIYIQGYLENGRFTLNGVTPGSYVVVAYFRGTIGTRVAVEVGNSDIENLQVVIRYFDIPIRTAREGEPLSGRFAPEVRLWPLPPGRFNASINSNLSGVTPGDYRVEVSSATYVKSMKLGDVEVTGNVIHIGTQPPGSLDLMFPRDPARISGHALDPVTREPVPASTVVLVPADRSRMELYRVGSSDNSGAFRFEGMKPGNYKVFAWRLVAHDAWKIPDFLSEYESRGVAVQIEDGMRTAFDVEVIP